MHRILLVDDDSDLRLLFSSALKAHGLEVLEANTLSAARSRLKGGIDLLVVGDQLPDGSGLGFVRECREIGLGLIVLHTSAPASQVANWSSQDRHAAIIIQKPVAPVMFARHMVRLLQDVPRSGRVEHFPDIDREPLELELTKIGQSFSSRLPAKLEELNDALSAAREDTHVLRQARILAHRLRGTAGSFGYEHVGDLVGTVEDLLIKIDQGEQRSPFLWECAERILRDASKFARIGPDSAPATPGRFDKRHRHPLLVIDDDPEFLRLVRAYARRHSLAVVTARTMEEGVERAGGEPLAGVLLDVHLAEQTSWSAVRRIRAAQNNDLLPVFFASVDGRLETRIAAVAAGANRFLDKPISEQRFSELLLQFPFAEPQAVRLVILDDDEIVLEKYESDLREAGYYVKGLTSPADLIPALDDLRPDVLLLDVNLEDTSGIDVCRALRCSERWQFLPILMFSGDRDLETRARAFQAGASDVLGKPLSSEELMIRVNVQAERIRSMRDHSDRDSLSGLMLRRAFVESVQRGLATCCRQKRPLSIVLLDLDHFKEINDRYGHLAGDRVIASFGALLRRRFRLEDLRGRWGGEEFVLAFPGQGREFATSAAQGLLTEFSKMSFDTEDHGQFRMTFTAGIAAYPEDGESLDLLMKRADELLYNGKAQGRARVCSAEAPGMGLAAEDA